MKVSKCSIRSKSSKRLERSALTIERVEQLELFEHLADLKFSDEPDHFAHDRKLPARDGDRSVTFVLRLQRDEIAFLVKSLERRLAIAEGADNLSVLGRSLSSDDHVVPVQDAGIDHPVPFDPHDKCFPARHLGRDSQEPFDILFGDQRFACGNPAQNRDLTGRGKKRFSQRRENLDCALADSANIAFLFQGLEMIRNAVGGSDFEPGADLRNRRGVALLPDAFQEKIVDLLLPGSEFEGHEQVYTENIFRCQATKKPVPKIGVME